MNEIRCPNCGKVFQVDESGYAAILKQVRDHEFAEEVRAREAQLKRERDSAVEMTKLTTAGEFKETLAAREAEIERLKSESVSVQQALRLEKENALVALRAEKDRAAAEQAAAVQRELAELRARLLGAEQAAELRVRDAVSEKERELAQKEQTITELSGKVENARMESDLKEKSLREQFVGQLKAKDEAIAYYKDLKTRMSTKMVGETLEQHCENEFNTLRAAGFRNAYFEKDNDARSGSKGDYIFRDYSDEGTEYISIMFEMKNEMDTTATKHKNEDFFRELDRDRSEKKCEYAVLVSLLEADSDLYNTGIVDVSHRYPKMYVIRPQFFIPMITLLRNAAQNSLAYRNELAQIRSQNIDITHFEEQLEDFKDKFSRNYDLASSKFKTAVEEIDKTIQHLQKVKDNLLSTENNLRLANKKLEDVSVKRLTRDNPTMAEKFAALHKEGENA